MTSGDTFLALAILLRQPSVQLPTCAEFKEKLHWGGLFPVCYSCVDFDKLVGKHDKMQTIGESIYWYYQCSDGTIQLDIEMANLYLEKRVFIKHINNY